MSPGVILLILLSAVCHVTWNLLLKSNQSRLAFTWWMTIVSFICCLPLGLRQVRLEALAGLWPIVLGSGLAEAAYVVSLTRAYELGDFSQVYPIARGSSPLLVALAAVAVLGERISPTGTLGIALIVVGVYVCSYSEAHSPGLRRILGSPATCWALSTALCTTAYSILDKVGVGILAPVPYWLLVSGAESVVLTPYAWWRAGRAAIREEIKAHSLHIVGAGLGILLGYLLFLWAMTLAQVSYATAARQISIVLGAAVGHYLFREPFGRRRALAATLMFAGIICLALAH
jgi:drug/metabolite transporter (DMT)-like permease